MLAGSAVNEWKDRRGKYNPEGGAMAMEQAIKIHENDDFDPEPRSTHVERLHSRAKELGYKELVLALKQRYPEKNL